MNTDTLDRYTSAIDSLCIEAAHSDDQNDESVMRVLLDIAIWDAERVLGYGHELAGEVDHWCNSCWEDSRAEYWYPKLQPILKSAESFDEKVALGLALHRGAWYLERVRQFGAKPSPYSGSN